MLEQNLEKFLDKKSKKGKIIVIYGPTCCGKTNKSIEIAKKINSEIISTDSRQIFKYLNIGTGKIKEDEKEGIIHHMLDIIEPNMDYSVGEFKKTSEILIKNILKKGKIPILVGGTGLYIDSLIYDFKIPKIQANKELRENLEKEALVFGKEYVYEKLKKLDPNYAEKLHFNNLRYVIRGLEIKILTGKSKLDFVEEKKLKYDTFFINPYDNNREKLYENINKRIEIMFEEGFVDEVKNLIKMGYKKEDFGMKTIGYKEIIDFLEGSINLSECKELIKKNNRNYAKRQLTWFRKYENLPIPTFLPQGHFASKGERSRN